MVQMLSRLFILAVLHVATYQSTVARQVDAADGVTDRRYYGATIVEARRVACRVLSNTIFSSAGLFKLLLGPVVPTLS